MSRDPTIIGILSNISSKLFELVTSNLVSGFDYWVLHNMVYWGVVRSAILATAWLLVDLYAPAPTYSGNGLWLSVQSTDRWQRTCAGCGLSICGLWSAGIHLFLIRRRTPDGFAAKRYGCGIADVTIYWWDRPRGGLIVSTFGATHLLIQFDVGAYYIIILYYIFNFPNSFHCLVSCDYLCIILCYFLSFYSFAFSWFYVSLLYNMYVCYILVNDIHTYIHYVLVGRIPPLT